MTSKQMEYYQAVCRAGNISTAADELYVSRSVVSRTIAELEEEFGTTLFVRSRTGVVPTASGTLLAHLFDSFLTSCGTVKDRIGQMAEQVEQPLCLGVTPTNAYCIYKTYLEGFRSLYPDIQLYVTEHSAYDCPKLLLDGTIDVSFSPVKPELDMFGCLDLYQNPIMLGAAEGDRRLGEKVGITDLIDLPLGFYNARMPLEQLLTASFAVMGKKPRVMLRTSDQMLLRELTLQGKIYPILPLDMMAIWEGVRQIPLDFFQSSTNRLIWNQALSPAPALSVFLDYMKKQVL